MVDPDPILRRLADWSRPFRRGAAQLRARLRFRRTLQLLNDVLATTPLADRYWIRAGLLLGWAREGRPLGTDLDHADFGYFAADQERLDAAVPPLLEAGFERHQAFFNNEGRITEYTFRRSGIRFDFIQTTQADDQLEYFLYAPQLSPPQQLRCRVPHHGLSVIRLVGRTWHKPEPHEPYLETLYGDWRRPDPGFSYLQAGSIVERSHWQADPTWSDPR